MHMLFQFSFGVEHTGLWFPAKMACAALQRPLLYGGESSKWLAIPQVRARPPAVSCYPKETELSAAGGPGAGEQDHNLSKC